jgi:hypothetical protein
MVCIFSLVIQTVCCLFAVVISKWLLGAFMLVLFFVQVLVICTFGTILSIKVT